MLILLSTHNANNECLGDIDRGRTHIAAILVGEVLQTCDPAVSEWSNPLLYGVASCKDSDLSEG